MPKNGILFSRNRSVCVPRKTFTSYTWLDPKEEKKTIEVMTDDDKKEVDRLVEIAKKHNEELKKRLLGHASDSEENNKTSKISKTQKQPIRLSL